ncbi:phosphoribosylformylglycinamidine synthase [Lutibacter sp. B2]|nr:phosphoribosylformylglycinamidine synthase [Lutibacter sp. B2]
MNKEIRRIYVEKKEGFNIQAEQLGKDLKENLKINKLKRVRILNRYDIAGISEEAYKSAKKTIFSEATVDFVYDEEFPKGEKDFVFGIEYLPGQYDQRADSAMQCVEILTQNEKPMVVNARIIVLEGELSKEEFEKIKAYTINPVDSREASLEKAESLEIESDEIEEVQEIDGFIEKSENELAAFHNEMGFAMKMDDLKLCQEYFKNEEKRNPTIAELKAIDTYWSDHCRHTTFFTKIEDVEIEDGLYKDIIQKAYDEYLQGRAYVYEDKKKDISLMDMAQMSMRELRKQGKLPDLDVSEEINACSICVDVDIDGKKEEWLVMFKNETHNHPTEIEPFGGAATCLGGAIRDPLSGRSYVYQAMRVTGSADPRKKLEHTLEGKLPQRKITTEAAHGYSSYGNQIGLPTGQVAEVYDEGFAAKRMEIGAVIAAAPKENVIRTNPIKGDIVILVGGRTGRDGCGGATGSSKAHTKESIHTCGAEVQKGNPPTERKIQRLFRNKKVSQMIKRCNDFGAGGVSVAIGELADSLEIDLNAVPKKYEGLNGTELAISESQERMAVVVDKNNVEDFIKFAREENVEATVVAKVTDDGRLRIQHNGQSILDIKREFLETNGVKQKTNVKVELPKEEDNYLNKLPESIKENIDDLKKSWLMNLEDLNVASQKGLVERFDSTVGGNSVLVPLGGKYQETPTEGMVAKIPVLEGQTNTATLMTYGYDPKLSKWSPFHGALYGVVEAVTKAVVTGGAYKNLRLTLQEYFEKLGDNPTKWGKPFAGLLGAYYAQKNIGIPGIGGKDSMSGSFGDLHVPPTVVTFAVDTLDVRNVISPEFKKNESHVVWINVDKDQYGIPNFENLKNNYEVVSRLIKEGKVVSASSIKVGGIAAAISKMSFGNRIGMKFNDMEDYKELFKPYYGTMILEIDKDEELEKLLENIDYKVIGNTIVEEKIIIENIELSLEEMYDAWKNPLEKIFPTKADTSGSLQEISYKSQNKKSSKIKVAKPRIFVPIFPGTNCEYETKKTFEEAGGIVDTVVFRNLSGSDIKESIKEMAAKIRNSQMIMLPGGFSAGDEPDGSGKFIATAFRNPEIKEAVMDLLNNRDGLVLGICNGFQALIKLGLLPYGEIKEIKEDDPTLTFNKIGRHMSRLVRTKVVSNQSPWLNHLSVGDIHTIAISHGEGRFIAPKEKIQELIKNGQIATQYVDFDGNPTYDIEHNPNGSIEAIEGITSPDGRVFGKMAHSERMGQNIAVNVPGNKDQQIFRSGVEYFL